MTPATRAKRTCIAAVVPRAGAMRKTQGVIKLVADTGRSSVSLQGPPETFVLCGVMREENVMHIALTKQETPGAVQVVLDIEGMT